MQQVARLLKVIFCSNTYRKQDPNDKQENLYQKLVQVHEILNINIITNANRADSSCSLSSVYFTRRRRPAFIKASCFIADGVW